MSSYWIGWEALSWGCSWGCDATGEVIEVEEKIKWDDVGGGPERHELDDWDYPLPTRRRSRDDKDLMEMMQMIQASGVLQSACLRTPF